MAVYLYRAKKDPYNFLEGQIEASSRQEALAKIDSLGLFPVWIEEKAHSLKIPPKVSLRELTEFTHQLSTLVNSGLTLLGALNTLTYEIEQVRLKPLLLDIVSQIKSGEEFSQALKKYPHIFSPLYTSLVKIGETSGTLGENLKRIAQFLEEELDFRTNIVSILIYPCLIAGVGVLTVFTLLRFVIPKLVDIFQEIGQTLPLPTAFLINVSQLFSRYWILILGVVILLFFGGRRYFNNPHNKLQWGSFKLRMPMLGDLFKKIEVCRFSRTLSMLLRNGVPIDASLKVLVFTLSNLFFKKQIEKISERIREGVSLNEAMKKTEVFPSGFINVVTVGEETGALDKVLEAISEDYSKEINRKIKRLLTILEPFLIMSVGLIVGFVVLSMLLPIFQIDFNF